MEWQLERAVGYIQAEVVVGEDENYHCYFRVENSWGEQEGGVKGYHGILMGLLDNSDTFVEVLDLSAR